MKSFVGWIAKKFIEDDDRWDEITQSLITEANKFLIDIIPSVIDRIRNAINLALTGEDLFDFDGEATEVEV